MSDVRTLKPHHAALLAHRAGTLLRGEILTAEESLVPGALAAEASLGELWSIWIVEEAPVMDEAQADTAWMAFRRGFFGKALE
ncbi:MAG: hypothetical protein AB7S36_20935 [Planctomycetota bacterium]